MPFPGFQLTTLWPIGTPGRPHPGALPFAPPILFPLKATFVAFWYLQIVRADNMNPGLPILVPQAQVNDIGVPLVVVVYDQDGNVVDLAQATGMTIKLKYPSGNTVDKTATLFTNGSDGKMQYVTIDGDLSESGIYSIQGELTIGGVTVSTREGDFNVRPNIDDN